MDSEERHGLTAILAVLELVEHYLGELLPTIPPIHAGRVLDALWALIGAIEAVQRPPVVEVDR